MDIDVRKNRFAKPGIFLAAALQAALCGCTGLSRPPENVVRNPNGTYQNADVGSPAWWDKNRSRAVLVIGEGYRVPGVDGFFDDSGRPIGEPIAPVTYEEPEDDSILGAITPDISIDRLKTAIGQGPNAQAARTELTKGQQLYEQKRFTEAANAFEHAAKSWPGSDIEQDTLFMAGERLFFADKYDDAANAYELLLKKYPGTTFLDRAIARQWSIAQYWQKRAEKDPEWSTTPNFVDKTRPWFDTRGRALKLYDNIRMNDPTGPWSDDALMATATTHFVNGRFEDADYHFELLRTEYPRSEHQFNAHLLGLQCKLRIYQGPQYDGTALDEAEKLVKQLRMQFGGALEPEQRARVDEIAARIAKHRALRDWEVARFFDRGKHFGAAKVYYARIAKTYPESEIAASARARLTEIAGEPDVPPEKLSWFINLFPESRERRRIADIPIQNTTTR